MTMYILRVSRTIEFVKWTLHKLDTIISAVVKIRIGGIEISLPVLFY